MILTGKAKEDFLTMLSILTEIKDKNNLEEYFSKISHLISIAHGGRGHWDGDGCCNSSLTASIEFILPFLLITAILIVVFSTKKLKDDDESF